jgi:hypothetical protein
MLIDMIDNDIEIKDEEYGLDEEEPVEQTDSKKPTNKHSAKNISQDKWEIQ